MPYTRLTPDGQPVVYRSAANGAAAQTALGPLKWFSAPRVRVVLPLTARDANCDIQAQLQHGPSAAGPWANVGAAAQVNDATDNVALLSGAASARSAGPLLPFLRVLLTVTSRLGAGNPQVTFTAVPALTWESYAHPKQAPSLQLLDADAALASNGDGSRKEYAFLLPVDFDGAQLRAALDVTARAANANLDCRVDHAIGAAGPWANAGAGNLFLDATDNLGLLTGYLDEAAVGPILPRVRVVVGIAHRNGAGNPQVTATASVYALLDAQPDAPPATRAAATGVTVGNAAAAGTLDNQTPAIAAAVLSMAQDLGTPAAPDTTSVHAAFAGNDAANDFPGPFANPDVPRAVQIAFAAGWDGGNVTVNGTDQFDQAVNEVIVANPGATVVGTKVFKTVTSASKGAVGANAAGASIGRASKLGVGSAAVPRVKDFNTRGVGELSVDGITEASTWDGTNSAVTPTTAPNGARRFVAVYAADRTLTQAAHTHTFTGIAHSHPVTDPQHQHLG
ncbi:hypothetical protein L6R50_19820 [Myxococcota bacterium]|nr:hypothetical protein [Myxococcota bacterium]